MGGEGREAIVSKRFEHVYDTCYATMDLGPFSAMSEMDYRTSSLLAISRSEVGTGRFLLVRYPVAFVTHRLDMSLLITLGVSTSNRCLVQHDAIHDM